jgi:hypothetical protein
VIGSGVFAPWALEVPQISGLRFWPHPFQSQGTTAYSNGNMRIAPAFLASPVLISHLGAEVTGVGDSGSTFLTAVYSNTLNNGGPWPGVPLASGSIAADSATVQEAALASQVLLGPGWYWIGGVVQNNVTVNPTLRSLGGIPMPGMVGNALPGAATAISSYVANGVTGALPSPFPTAYGSSGGNFARIHLRVA